MVEAVVEFDYEAQQDDELSLTVGDIIVNIRRDDGGWWEGELGGRRGLFPDNFVREIKKEGKRDGGHVSKSDLSNGRASPVSDLSMRPGRKGEQIRKRRCKAAFSYVPQHEDELELKIGDVIEIIAEVEEGWWEGILNGKTGMFPSNFTKEILPESDIPTTDTTTSQEELRSNRTSKDSPGSESDGGDGRSDTGSGEIQPKKVKGFGFGDIFKDQPIKLRPRSVEADTEGEKVSEGKAASVALETMKTDPDGKVKGREQCKVLFPYEAQNEDELSIKEGEIITIITKECADAGWWMGEVGGRQGVFPDNFVKLFVPEVEKERPKKPPPPSAPSAKQTIEKKSEVKKVPPERPEHLPQRDQDRGEEMKVGDIIKPTLPSFLPKKPLPPKTSCSSSSHPPRRPERPPSLASESPKSEGGASTTFSASDRSHDTDMDLDAVVSSAEKLSHPTASRPRVTDRRPRSQIITPSSLPTPELLDAPVVEDKKERTKEEQDSASARSADASLRKGVPAVSVPEGKSALPVKPAVLSLPNSTGHRPASPSSSSALSPSPELRHSPVSPPMLEELRNQLRDLRASIELLKSQHRQEMKQLTSALDEEKKSRLSLQMEVEHIKKSLSK
ncbi:SH3 domain-containing kinase-binding protein 1 isoform X2 [Thalassophryne amazonica]|uniref:SH3 domain-containing kinase-binding protein 1 isoform X2 n=1 Tax=Thalassophryne amazonica TaxID=390379 RepID=UPI0014723F01|nr:SH3 domain-containing kinase-binding protein 1 isoform X2 [Thalassophryne amazonica]